MSKTAKQAMAVDDVELVTRTLSGDVGAFEELVKRYQVSIYNLVFRLVRNEGAAADVAQMAFIKAYEGLRSFRGGSSFKTWLYRIAINLSKNYLRDQGRRKEDLGEVDTTSASNPLEVLIEDERRQLFHKAFKTLSARQRLVVKLKVDEGMGYREIAKIMGCSVGTVKASFHYACARLREILREEGDEMS